MNKLTLIIVFFCTAIASLQATPTSRHVEKYAINGLLSSKKVGNDTAVHLRTFLKIAERETKDTFFAYHGMTQQNRIFQDILHAVFEEVLKIPLSKNFYFIRFPSENTIREEEGVEGFLDKISIFSTEFRDRTTQYFFEFIQEKTTVVISRDDFSEIEFGQLWDFLLACSKENQKVWWAERAARYTLPATFNNDNFDQQLLYVGVSQLICDALDSRGRHVEAAQCVEFFQNHSKLYVDLLNFLSERQKDTETEYKQEFDKFMYFFDDTRFPQKSLLISLNVSLFGNYNVGGSFTPDIYVTDRSTLGSEFKIKSLLIDYFNEIGLDERLVQDLWNRGASLSPPKGKPQGCLLQLFDQSAKEGLMPFAFINRHAFVSFKYGVPLLELSPSELVMGSYPVSTNGKDLELRLITSLGSVLNPFSSLRMIRYDGLHPKKHAAMMKKMKKTLKKSVKDKSKIQRYRQVLERYWNVSFSPLK